MAKSRKNIYDERTRLPESEAHQTRRVSQRQIDDLLKCDLHELEDEWDEYDEINTFEKIRSPIRKSL